MTQPTKAQKVALKLMDKLNCKHCWNWADYTKTAFKDIHGTGFCEKRGERTTWHDCCPEFVPRPFEGKSG